MKKYVIIIIYLLICLVGWSGGSQEKNPPVPQNANWLIGADIQNLSNSSLFESLLVLFPFFRHYGLAEGADLTQLNQLLSDRLGFSLRDIQRVYLWNDNLHLVNQAEGFGYIVRAMTNNGKTLLDKLKINYPYSLESEATKEIIVVNYISGKMYVTALGPYLCMSESREKLNQMIHGFQNKRGIQSHKSLSPLFAKYSSQSLFICADLKYQKAQWLVPPLDMVDLFSASILIDQRIVIHGEANQASEKKAKQFYNMLVLSLNLISQIVPPDRPEIKKAYKFLMKPLTVKHKGIQVLFNCEYNEDILIHLKTLLEFGLELLYSGNF